MKIFRPKWLFVKNRFEENFELWVNNNGLIEKVVPVSTAHDGVLSVQKFPEHAMIPGFVNVHSHAFQRALRGLTQVRSPQQKDNFWTWRQAMYRLVNQLSPDDVYAISKLCFREMLSQGITTVGEFHYVHHQKGGRPYENQNELGLRVIAAAKDVGIRLCLLDSAYFQFSYGQKPKPEQKRFCDASLDAYLKRLEDLLSLGDQTLSFGLAPHSLRAVSETDLKEIAHFNQRRGLPVHMHLHEQEKEVAEALRFYKKKTPIEVVATTGLMQQNFTAIHATHLRPKDVRLLKKHEVHVAACPSTEADLGDGILSADTLVNQKIPICFGSDSQVQINFFNECRLIENHLRLRTKARNLISPSPAKTIFPFANAQGAKSLGIKTGELRQGYHADFAVLRLDHVSLEGVDRDRFLTQLLFSSAGDLVAQAYVGGKCVFDR